MSANCNTKSWVLQPTALRIRAAYVAYELWLKKKDFPVFRIWSTIPSTKISFLKSFSLCTVYRISEFLSPTVFQNYQNLRCFSMSHNKTMGDFIIK